MKQTNFEKYWKLHWRVLQTPKIAFDLLAKDGWEVYDINLNGACATVAKDGGQMIRVDYVEQTGGVSKITVRDGGETVYQQQFSFLLKPTVAEIEKILKLLKIEDWRKYYTAC